MVARHGYEPGISAGIAAPVRSRTHKPDSRPRGGDPVTTFATDSQSFMYLEVTIPEGLTIAQYRRARPPRRHGLARLRRPRKAQPR